MAKRTPPTNPALDVATRLREFPLPPRKVLIDGAGEIERLRRDLAKAQDRIKALEDEAAETVQPLTADGFDAAILAVTQAQPGRQALVVYDLDKMVRILMDRDGLNQADALEHLMFNAVGAWLGKGTPIFAWRRWKGSNAQGFLAEHFGGE
jgi:hypothetical protein